MGIYWRRRPQRDHEKMQEFLLTISCAGNQHINHKNLTTYYYMSVIFPDIWVCYDERLKPHVFIGSFSLGFHRNMTTVVVQQGVQNVVLRVRKQTLFVIQQYVCRNPHN